MHPILFHIPGTHFPIYSYGLMMVIGFFLAMQLAKFLARRKHLDPEIFVNAALLALVAGVGGARASDVLENLHQFTRADHSFTQNFLDMINIRQGGLTYYGGVILATPTLILYFLLKKVPLRTALDVMAPCLMIGLGFGRIGCYLNGCCYGVTCNVPWISVQFPYGSDAYITQYNTRKLPAKPDDELLHATKLPGGKVLAEPLSLDTVNGDPHLKALARLYKSQPVVPSQLFSSFTAFLLAGVLLAFMSLPHFTGRVFALMCMLEGSSRFALEMLRVEPAVLGPLSLSMVIGLLLAILGVILWLSLNHGGKEAGGPLLTNGFWARV